jgi:hypothetical protein
LILGVPPTKFDCFRGSAKKKLGLKGSAYRKRLRNTAIGNAQHKKKIKAKIFLETQR